MRLNMYVIQKPFFFCLLATSDKTRLRVSDPNWLCFLACIRSSVHTGSFYSSKLLILPLIEKAPGSLFCVYIIRVFGGQVQYYRIWQSLLAIVVSSTAPLICVVLTLTFSRLLLMRQISEMGGANRVQILVFNHSSSASFARFFTHFERVWSVIYELRSSLNFICLSVQLLTF